MLLGRAAELARIDELLSDLHAGRGAALALLGEPGIGKSALLDELVEQAGDVTVLRAAAAEVDQPLAYRALADLLAPVWRELRERDDDEAAVLTAALGVRRSTERPSETAIGMALLDTLSRAADVKPVLIVLDDVEWMDESSRLALGFVARRVAVEGIGLAVASCQPAEQLAWLGRLPRVDVGPLAEQDAAELAAAVSAADRAPLAASTIAFCWESTGGNTLAFTELIRSLDDDERAGRRHPSIDVALASDLGRACAQRVGALPVATRRGLGVLALAGSAAPASIVIALASLGLSTSDLQPALQSGVLNSLRGDAEFEHALLRSAAIATLDPGDLRDVHRALAAAFDGLDDGRHAWHLSASIEWVDEEAAQTLERLAERDAARGALAEAGWARRRAAELSAEPRAAAQRFVQALQDWWANGQVQLCLEQSMSPLFRVRDSSIELPRALVAGQALAFTGSPRQGIEVLRQAAANAADLPAQAAIALASASSFMGFTEGLTPAAALSREAVEMASASGDAIASLVTAAVCGWHDLLLARTDEAAQRLAPLEMMVDSLVPVGGDASHFVLLIAMYRMVSERFDEATSLLERLIDMSVRRGWVGWSDFATRVLAALHLRTGMLTDAWAITSQPPDDGAPAAPPLSRAWGFGLAAQVAAAMGRIDDTERAVAAARAGADELDLPPLRAWAAAARGHLELSRDDAATAADLLIEADAVFRRFDVHDPGMVWCQGDLIDALVRSGRVDDARAAIARLDGIAQRTHRAWLHAVVHRGRGALADEDDESEAEFQAALAWHEGLGAPLERARTLLSRARVRLARGQVGEAGEDLAEAASVFRGSGAELWAAQAEALTGQSPTASRPTLTSTLSPAELRVALAVGAGLSNKQVARQLFVSVKTVDFHLRSIYNKGNLRSRTELALALAAEKSVVHS